MTDDNYYSHHVFFCTNLRETGDRECCQQHNAAAMRDYMKQRIKEQGMNGKGAVRVNSAGCLDRCESGPVVVVYPAGVWYTWVDEEDIDEIVEEHLKNGRIVERLQLKS